MMKSKMRTRRENYDDEDEEWMAVDQKLVKSAYQTNKDADDKEEEENEDEYESSNRTRMKYLRRAQARPTRMARRRRITRTITGTSDIDQDSTSGCFVSRQYTSSANKRVTYMRTNLSLS